MIWHSRNNLRFENKVTYFRTTTNYFATSVHLTGNSSKGSMSSLIQEFSILKAFQISCHACQALRIKEVIWKMPPCNWVKCNSDAASKGNPGWSACGGIFRDYMAAALGCFAANLGVSSSLYAELIGAILAVEHAHLRSRKNLWLECDSQFVVAAFKLNLVVPWK